MINLGVDIHGLSETNRPWSQTNKWKYNFMMDQVFQQARTVYASLPTDRTTNYQPRGNSITRDNVGQIQQTGHDPMGRFAWTTMRGKQDEGLLVIVAYCSTHRIPTTMHQTTTTTTKTTQPPTANTHRPRKTNSKKTTTGLPTHHNDGCKRRHAPPPNTGYRTK